MSNRNPDESSGHRKPKVSLAMMIIQGLGGPNLVPLLAVLGMDSRLIFRPPHCVLLKRRRKGDEEYYWIYLLVPRIGNPKILSTKS